MLTLDKCEEASEKVREVTLETKLVYSDYLSNLTGNKVYLKPENMQFTGAYKVRGAYYKISTLTDEERAKGLITASAGNHAQGVAYAAKCYGCKATIVMPTTTPLIKVNRTKSGEMPLSAFEDFGTFKLFMLDVGLMCAMNKLSPDAILLGNDVFSTYRGAMTEQYVCQQLVGEADSIYYWTADNSRGEIDFLIQKGNKIIPIEVKAEENLRAKSLSAFVARYPSLHALRLSMSDYRDQDWMTNVPLYAVCNITECVSG